MTTFEIWFLLLIGVLIIIGMYITLSLRGIVRAIWRVTDPIATVLDRWRWRDNLDEDDARDFINGLKHCHDCAVAEGGAAE